MFNVGYFVGRNELVLDPALSARHYLIPSSLPTFLLDFIACFPLDYFFLFSVSGEMSVLGPMKGFGRNPWFERIALMRLPRALQFYKMFLAGHKIDKTIFKSLTFIT